MLYEVITGVTEGQTWVSRNYGTTDVLVKYRILPYDIAGTANYIRIGHVRLDVDRFCAAQGGAHSTNNQDTVITSYSIHYTKLYDLVTLKGHRSVGGMRASIYNAMPYEGVEKLVNFMAEFEKTNS